MANSSTPLVQVLPAIMALMYSMFIYLTLISPKTLWLTHYPDRPTMDPVFSYCCKAKGAAILGLLTGLLWSYTKPLAERQVAFLSCLVFQAGALFHHYWCYFTEPEEYFVDSAMHFQYVFMHTTGCVVFSYLIHAATTVSKKTTKTI